MPKAKILFAMPRYGPVERESENAMVMAHQEDADIEIHINDKCTSALPHQFSQSWADMLSSMHIHHWTHFGMLHSDVAPVCAKEDEKTGQRYQVPWLSIMREEMEKHSLDVIHALVPIKGPMGVFSTAVGVSAEPFCRLCRVAIKETPLLPDTFTAAEYVKTMQAAGKLLDFPRQKPPVMLNNTGCMLVKWRPEFARYPGFRFITELKHKAEDGKWHSMVEGRWREGFEVKSFFWPEDWDFGQWCHRNGLRVGATKKVETFHFGRHGFSCDPTAPWAWTEDKAWALKEGQYS